MTEKIITSRSVHIIYGVLFAAIAIAALFALLAYRSFTESGTQSSTVTNVAPAFNLVAVSDASDTTNYTADSGTTAFTMVENVGDTIYIHGEAYDNNGCDDITAASSTWSLVLHNNDTTYTACDGGSATANVNCYDIDSDASLPSGASFSTATCTGGGGSEEIKYEWAIPLTFYTDYTAGSGSSGNWTAVVGIDDDYLTGTSAVSSSDTFEIDRIAALDVDSIALNFGSLALGGAASATSSITIKNTANGIIDFTASANDFTCDTGKIAASKIKFDNAAGNAYASMAYSLSNGGTTLTGLNLNPQVAAASSSAATYWSLQLPSAAAGTGAGGSCSTAVTISAVDGN